MDIRAAAVASGALLACVPPAAAQSPEPESGGDAVSLIALHEETSFETSGGDSGRSRTRNALVERVVAWGRAGSSSSTPSRRMWPNGTDRTHGCSRSAC